MTKQELNRDVKRLYKTYQALKDRNNNEEYFKAIDEVIRPEFKRLYRADREMQYLNKKSILILLTMNLSQRFVSLHSFGLNIEL